MRNLKKIVSILLSLALLLSAISISFTVSAEKVDGFILNGDFEEGQTGFLCAEDADMNVKVYDNADTTRPGYGTVALDGKAAYLPSMSETAKTNLLQYKINNLPEGTYTIKMDALVNVADASVWAALGFGITDTIWSTGVAYGPNMISNTAKATKNGSEITVNSTAVYHRLAGSTLTDGWSDVDVEISFSTAETKTLYLFMYSGATANAYIDNIVLERVSENGVINNGDFEAGQKGFLNAEVADMNIKVYDNADASRPGYGTVTLDGKAAYIPGGSTKNDHLQYKINNLPAGTYTIKMDALVNVTDASVWGALGFGITDTIYNVAGIAYGNNMISNTAKATKNGSEITVNSTAVYHRLAGSTLTAGWSDTDVEISFSIAETKTLYLFMFATANQSSVYIDNITLERVSENGVINNGDFEAGQKGFLNAEDADMNVKVYDNADTTRPGYGTVTLDGKAAYLPSMSETAKTNLLQYSINNLPAGKYTISMDALVEVNDVSAWAALGFGITDTIWSSGVAYGPNMISNTSKATKNDSIVTVNSTAVYHRLSGNTLASGWSDVDVEITFEITETKTLYLFVFAGAENKSNAYIDNIELFKSATINYCSVNTKGGTIARGNFTDNIKIGSNVSKERPVIENYSFIGYKVGLDGEIIADNVYKATVETDADIYFMYALRGDLNDDLSTNALDLTLLRKYLLGVDTECNIFGARVNNIDEEVDIRDLVALKKKVIGMGNVLIFGDSISTFDNYIPYGNSTFYGGGANNTDVTNVEETWWHQVIEETYSNLILNDSWSGSTISHTGVNNTDTSKTSSFVYRLNKHVSEGFFDKNVIDTVYLFGGTNDSYANSPIGQLQFSDWKEEDLFSFLPAMCYILNTLQEVAPNAEIVCIINSDLKAEISEGMVTACEHYGVSYVQLENIDKVGVHPTVKGMTQIKDAVLGDDK